MVVIEGVILESIVRSLITWLNQILLGEFSKGRAKDETLPGRLKSVLLGINAVLTDAEAKQYSIRAVRYWLDEVRDAVYAAEDVCDDLDREASTTNWLWDSLPSFSKSKLKDVTERLESLDVRIATLNLKVDTKVTHLARTRSTSHIGKQELVGRETEKDNIMRFLMGDEEDYKILAIVGMAGVGKTVLAQLLFKEEFFHDFTKAWIYMSEEIDVFSITKTLYQSLTSGGVCDFCDLNLLQDNLKNMLAGKKLLLVLDDMWRWSDAFQQWNFLCTPFPKGSCIIVTTRNYIVATNVDASHIHTVQPLALEHCWRILMEEQPCVMDRDFGILADDVLSKCEGLPLAAKGYGKLLWSNIQIGYWKKIISSKIWTAPTNTSNILAVLLLSYHYLPTQLKRCFAYCSIFPNGYAFDKKMVILLWMAEGLLQEEASTDMDMEDVGDMYFSELVSNSLFQQSESVTDKFIMHGLIHELAQYAAGEFCLNQIEGITARTRHLSYKAEEYIDKADQFDLVRVAKFLRTFLPLSLEDSSPFCTSITFDTDKLIVIVSCLSCLRVLCLSDYSVPRLPSDFFKKMHHLRYLDLSGTDLQRLPTSLHLLYNLQTLLLMSCAKLIELGEGMCDLTRLECLDLTETTSLRQMPPKFGRLRELKSLTSFVVGVGKGAKISELRHLTKLRGKLSILELNRIADIREAEEAHLESKSYLKQIDFTWRREPYDVSAAAHNEEQIFEKLRPSDKIEEVTITAYHGSKFPSWMSDKSFDRVVQLRLIGCRNCTSLGTLGQLSRLRKLYISHMRSVTIISSEFYTSNPESIAQHQQPFKALLTLSFKDMPNWKTWANVKVYGGSLFPKLEVLSIVNCPQLATELPGSFPSLSSLKMDESESLIFKPDSDKFPKLQPLPEP